MLNVFDSYSRESQDLLHSMKESGFDHPTVILEPNGFLPDGVESPFIYFLGQAKGEKRGRYFNEVPVPDFWGQQFGESDLLWSRKGSDCLPCCFL